jgi:hypothetical protein
MIYKYYLRDTKSPRKLKKVSDNFDNFLRRVAVALASTFLYAFPTIHDS